jgi:Concanavalin A-like lectin/glucanases superfamily
MAQVLVDFTAPRPHDPDCVGDMKSSRGVIIALGCAVAALALSARFWRVESDPPRAGALPGEVASGAAAPWGGDERDRGAPRPGGGGNTANARAGSAVSAGDRSARLRRRMAVMDAPQRLQRGSAAAARGRRGELDRPGDPGRTLKLSGDNLPDASSRGAQGAEGAIEDAAGQEIADVVYHGGADKVFDTLSQVKVDDAGAVSGDAGTIAFWIEPQWQRDGPSEATFVQLGDNGLQIFKQGDTLRFQYVANNGEVYGGGADIANWQTGDWRHVAATWMGRTLALYVDGAQLFLNGAPAPPDLQSDATLYVGSALAGGAPAAPGAISYLTVLNRTASGEEIMEMFESGGAP